MSARRLLWLLLAVGTAWNVGAQQKEKVDAATPAWRIILMNPRDVDATDLPLTTVESLHATGTALNVDLSSWHLRVSGKNAASPFTLTYDELLKLPMVKKRVLLICPGFFYDFLLWEGVSLQTLIERAGAGDYSQVMFTSVDGYTQVFRKDEIQAGLVMIALKGNGVPLPRAHGFPARVVAEGIYGGRWVKYVSSITLE